MKALHLQNCVELTAESTALDRDMVESNLQHLDDWQLVTGDEGYRLRRTFEFDDFSEAVQFLSELAERATRQSHFPQVELHESQLTLMWWSPQVQGLHQNDFIMAATTDDCYDRWDIISGKRDSVEQASDESFPASDPPAWS